MQVFKFNRSLLYPLIVVFYFFIFLILFPSKLNFLEIDKGVYSKKKQPAYDFINKYFHYLNHCKDGIFFIGPSTVREAFNIKETNTDPSLCITNGGVSSNGDIYFIDKQLSILENNLPFNYKIPILMIGINSRMILDRSFQKKVMGFNDLLSSNQLYKKNNLVEEFLYDLNLKKKYLLFTFFNFANEHKLIITKNNFPVFENHYKHKSFDEKRFKKHVNGFKEKNLWDKEKYFNKKELYILDKIILKSQKISNNPIFYVMPFHSIITKKLGNEFESFLPEYFSERKIPFINNVSSFNDTDLIDIAHLNQKGREKFEQILNSDVEIIINKSPNLN
jgi:hypothetical protein